MLRPLQTQSLAADPAGFKNVAKTSGSEAGTIRLVQALMPIEENSSVENSNVAQANGQEEKNASAKPVSIMDVERVGAASFDNASALNQLFWGAVKLVTPSESQEAGITFSPSVNRPGTVCER